jgi:peptidoglycan/xylan/chitin deacetylase (PgdA/CDA1 family)
MYHRVEPDPAGGDTRLCVPPRLFDTQLDWLSDHGYRPCSAADFADWFLGLKALPPGSVLITFDDGYAGLHEHALPRLSARQWPAAVFLLSGLIGQRDHWAADQSGTRGAHALLDRGQIAEMMLHGFEFHSHTRTHADLTTLDDAELQAQVSGSRQDLQDLLGTNVDSFAYPFGRGDDRVRRAVEAAGYRLAFSVRSGFNRSGADRLAVRRLDITGEDTRARFGRKLAMGSNDGSLSARLRYLAHRLGSAATGRALP